MARNAAVWASVSAVFSVGELSAAIATDTSLFHLALAQANLELKYILLSTAVEALIPDKRPLKEREVVAFL